MLKEADDQVLTKVGKGTPLGTMMRRYWHPISLSTQVEADGAPLRTRLLGERFVVFRDSDGRPGVLEEMCMHRGVSLALGRNEEGGLRCVYHGWKFAVDGTILETPNHDDCRYRERMKAPAFPVREQGGLIWTYIGPAEQQPPFRSFAYDVLPEENRTAFRSNTKANWLPLWEGGLDSSHVGMLHTDVVRPSWGAARRGDSSAGPVAWDKLSPTYEIEDTEFGYHYCAFRDLEGDKRNARLVPAIMPYGRIIPGTSSDGIGNYVFEVPMDDFETATYVVVYDPNGPVDRDFWVRFLGLDSEFFDMETCNVTLDADNRWGQDRSRMKTNWTGIQGLEMEDFAMSLSLGEDWDRGKEHLVTSDQAIVRMRRMVLNAVREVERGGTPPALNVADMTSVQAFDRNITSSDVWQELAQFNRMLEAAE